MKSQNCCDSRKHLVDLASELFKGKNKGNLNSMSNEQIVHDGIRQIIQVRRTDQLTKQTLRFLEQILSKNTKQDIEYAQSLLKDSPFMKIIKDIANYKITIIRQAQVFEEIIKNKAENLHIMFSGIVYQVFQIAKKDIKDLKPIKNIFFPSVLGLLTSVPFLDTLIQKNQAARIDQLTLQNRDLKKSLASLRESLENCQKQNKDLRGQISKVLSKQMILDDQEFQQKLDMEGMPAKKIPAEYIIKSLDLMNLTIYSTKELQSTACSTKDLFQEKTFTHQQTITAHQQFFVKQSQTNDFGQLLTQYIRPLEEVLSQKQKQLQQQKKSHQITMEDLNNAQIQMSIIRQMYRPKTLFQGEIFENNEHEKKILIRHIEEKREVLIDSTRLLYRYDPRNKTNFHQYIDGVEGIAFIVKSKKGFLFGAYYSGKIEPDKVLNEFGLLISISNDTSYPMIEPDRNSRVVRAVVWDQFYAIFGNAELRVKSGEDFIFSNFGIMNSYYKHNNKKLIDFAGEENKEIKFESYQFYQVRLALKEQSIVM